MTHDCETCQDTGEVGGYGILDCPDCNAPNDRATLNSMADLLMSPYDMLWFGFQRGKKSTRSWHTLAEDFEHFLSYSNLHGEPDDVKEKLLKAYSANWR